MALTQAQLVTLKAAILADPVLASKPQTFDAAIEIAVALNEQAAPDFYVWRTKLFQDAITQSGFDWTRVDNLSVGPARVWEWMFLNASRSIDPSAANVRAGIAVVWKGTAADLSVRLVVYGHCQRLASRFEKLFSVGAGVPSDVNGVGPATMDVEGPLNFNDVIAARALS